MTELLVETTDLTKYYGSRAAVDHIGLQVRRGEVYGFLGPNGAGKTTALRMLLGLVQPSEGTARVLGRRPGDPVALASIGMLVEAPAVYPYLSGRDNLRVLARYAGAPDSAVAKALDAVELTDRADDRTASYSLGMRQRLGVAAALLTEPELLILDEPTNGLDPAGMADMRELIWRLGAQGRTVLLSSHLLGEVQQICDRVGVLAEGRLLRQASVRELRGQGALRIVADPIDQARALLDQRFDARRVRPDGESLYLDIAPELAAEVNRELVRAGIAVHTLAWREPSLEEIFFELTGGSQ
ncbi:ABC-2 type transport system ATP-binding protein [Tamaricihabitans halophyticus]|uniref:ABC-2 type transport system ATP-binding protein n=1 Tax=Tamaricihabitans halophyticus TaxID=1262583 RepID=A0A4R2QAA8_9PSEU|nr:ATP-binding cassette domain-containing protein [Tamaricihabitans halophyticus]TCP45134.1 ABC-2 type transport system ATP-binding protein [Tamaricihabitans halophyticus]